jgi:uracil-DNA glycosylase family 4
VGNDGIIRPFNFGNEYEDNVGSGKILFNILWKLNVKREDIYITNLIKCSYNEKLRKNIQKYFAECFFLTKLEIALVKPKIIFLLGNEVHQFFETHKLMSIIPEQIIAISHPAFIYRSPGFKTKYEGIIKHHLTEAGLI